MSEERSPGDGALERLLRDASQRGAYIDDAGFTAKVMARLPRAANPALRHRILLGFALAAAIVGLGAFGGAAYIWQAVLDLVAAHHFGPAQIGVVALALPFYWAMFTVLRAEAD
jgi:hypothetical protein